MTEVAFFYPGWEEDLPGIVRCLKPGGLLAVSFRPRYFYALAVARARIWENVDLVLDRRTGPVLGFSTVFTWQTSAGIRDLIGRQPSLELLDLCGIGVCSGIAGDPHDGVCQPSQLSRAEQAHLKRLELTLGREVPDGGRYILAVARRRCA